MITSEITSLLPYVPEAAAMFPEEIQIFLKLPLNSIAICRCVCKLWHDLLSKSKFIKDHLDHTTRGRHHPSLVFKSIDSSFYSIDYASLSKRRYNAVQLDHPSPYEAGMQFESIEFDILGSCDGLICLGLYRASPIDIKEINNICVWNPITREYKNIQIRPPYYYHSLLNVTTYGFGYDSSVDDYKFVRIVHCKNYDHSQLEVYALGLGLWKAIEEIPYTFPAKTNRPGFLLNGALHWLGTAKKTSLIVSFDISNARLIDVSIPEETMQQEKHVGVLTDCLCLMSSARGRINVWVMLDYGVKDSWAKLYNFRSYSLVLSPLWIRNSEILMATKNEFVSYDQKDDKPRYASVFAPAKNNMKLKKSDSYCYYVKSLVSLKSGTYVEKRIVERDRKKRKIR